MVHQSRILLWVLAALLGTLHAQQQASGPDKKSAVREKLLRAPPDCRLIAENAARSIRTGEIAEADVSAEWGALCPQDELLLLYRISGKLDSVDAASPEIDATLWGILREHGTRRRMRQGLVEFRQLVATRAAQSSPRSTDGKLLKSWFCDGPTAFASGLRNIRDGKLHEFAQREAEQRASAMSMVMLANAGAWLPAQNLARLGEHPTLGFLFAIGYGDWAFGMAMDFRFLNAPADYLYYDPNTNNLQPTRSFFGLLLGLDIRWEFLKLGPFSLLAAGALGYDLISHRAAPRYSGLRPAFSDSLNLNGGLVWRYYFSAERAGFLEIDARIHRVNYAANGSGGDDLSGHYFTTVLAAGYRLEFSE